MWVVREARKLQNFPEIQPSGIFCSYSRISKRVKLVERLSFLINGQPLVVKVWGKNAIKDTYPSYQLYLLSVESG